MSTMEQPEPPSEVLIPSLPNDIALNILARVPRRYHAVLSAVSKPFRSAVSSPQFFAIRSLLNSAENIVYLNVGSYDLSHDNWFAVHRNLSPVSNNKLLQLAPVPRIPIDAQLNGSAYVAVGPKIYVLGGFTNEKGGMFLHSNVWVLDCRSHVWEHGPSMPTRCFNSKAAFLDGKLYVVGGVPSNKKSWVEVLDLAVGHWEAIPSPVYGVSIPVYGIELVDGKISIGLGEHDLRLDPMTKTWGGIENKEPLLLDDCHCVVDEVLYHSSGWRFRRFDKKIGFWKYLKGVTEGKPKYACGPKLLNLVGRLFMAFAEVRFGDTVDSKEGELHFKKKKKKKEGKFRVWCAEIDVTEDGDGDWWGRVRWSDKVPLLPERNWGSPRAHFNDKVCPYFCECLSVSL
ncbi:hypothetical protein TIFTF001_004170 [Ficus carica]|uniref:F-box domain-containing protein n=1 Tax=Ficus carica TaxID=3494 RepID=A0AA87ZID1_FICCA|nr:hypothetical protein TIFTF001_004170 [Ficus carica]